MDVAAPIARLGLLSLAGLLTASAADAQYSARAVEAGGAVRHYAFSSALDAEACPVLLDGRPLHCAERRMAPGGSRRSFEVQVHEPVRRGDLLPWCLDRCFIDRGFDLVRPRFELTANPELNEVDWRAYRSVSFLSPSPRRLIVYLRAADPTAPDDCFVDLHLPRAEAIASCEYLATLQ